ncbi:MAG: glycosyltransferase family 4 protein [Promethearchaeota archaeon]
MQAYKSNKKKILHITAHLGGGVGRVVLSYLIRNKQDPLFEHEVACLDYANDYAVDVSKNFGLLILEKMSERKKLLLEKTADSDIVLIHWWNHPLLFDFLVREELPPSRVIMWSHISGFHSPNVFTDKVLRYPDIFVFTTPLSYKTKEVQNLSKNIKKKLRVVWSTGGVENFSSIKLENHNGFNIGYIGTVDYSKMHPDFLNMCKGIEIPDAKFIVVGGPKEKELEQEAKNMGILEKFTFTGHVPDLTKYYSILDVFGYPLAPYHYGTCDQVLQMSMAVGIVPVVFSNPMESYMVKDGITGIIAKNKVEYIEGIKKLYRDQNLRTTLSKNAKQYAKQAFTLEKMSNAWKSVFLDVLKFPKTNKKWTNSKLVSDLTPMDVFLEALGKHGVDFISYYNAKDGEDRRKATKKIKNLSKSPAWQAKTKGTVQHYCTFFPNDNNLSVLSKIFNESEEN